VDLPQADDRAARHGEVLDDPHAAEALDVHVVEQHRLVARAHRRQQFHARRHRAEAPERGRELLRAGVVVDRDLDVEVGRE
jgi:hypothetical protein